MFPFGRVSRAALQARVKELEAEVDQYRRENELLTARYSAALSALEVVLRETRTAAVRVTVQKVAKGAE